MFASQEDGFNDRILYIFPSLEVNKDVYNVRLERKMQSPVEGKMRTGRKLLCEKGEVLYNFFLFQKDGRLSIARKRVSQSDVSMIHLSEMKSGRKIILAHAKKIMEEEAGVTVDASLVERIAPGQHREAGKNIRSLKEQGYPMSHIQQLWELPCITQPVATAL